MNRFRSLAATLVLAGAVAACSGDDSGTEPATTAAPSTSVAPTSSTSTTSTTSTTVAPTSTTLACDAPVNTAPVVKDFPQKLSTLYGDDVDTGGHICFERVVLNFAGLGEEPGYSVGYEPDPLVLASSGQPTVLKGDANLVIRVGAWMGPEGNFTGERQMFPKNVSKIREVTLIDNFESVMIWGVGVDRERPFKVFTLPDPFRLVIDISAVDEPVTPSTTAASSATTAPPTSA